MGASRLWRRRLTGLISAAISIGWLIVVVGAGWVGRVVGHWEAAGTMLAGSFLAGSSPEGGGAVAFPVFTKGLDVPTAVARTFGLCIQAVGMTMATVAIVLNRRRFFPRMAALASVAAVVGFVFGLVIWGDSGDLFWPSSPSTAFIKATFSIVLASTSVLMVRHLRWHDHGHADPSLTPDTVVVLATAAFAGGVLSSFTGTGANIAVFLVMVVVLGADARVALPTAIVVMTAVSVVGLVVLGIGDAQLDVAVEGDRVVSVGNDPTDLAASRTDLLGLWLAAVPVVVWGAPLGSWAASVVRESTLVKFVALLATVEVVTTVLLVDEIRRDRWLIAYLVIGLVTLPMLLIALARRRLGTAALTS